MDHDPFLSSTIDRPVHVELEQFLAESGMLEDFLYQIGNRLHDAPEYNANMLQIERFARLLIHPENVTMQYPFTNDESAFYIGGMIATVANELILGSKTADVQYANINKTYNDAYETILKEIFDEDFKNRQSVVTNRGQIASKILSVLMDSEGEIYIHNEEFNIIKDWADIIFAGDLDAQQNLINGYAFVRRAARKSQVKPGLPDPILSQQETDIFFADQMHGVEMNENGIHDLEPLDCNAIIVAELDSFMQQYRDVLIETDEQADEFMQQASKHMEAFLEESLGIKEGDEIVVYGEAVAMFYDKRSSKLTNMYPVEQYSRLHGTIKGLEVRPVPPEVDIVWFIQNYRYMIGKNKIPQFSRKRMVMSVQLILNDATIFEPRGKTVHPDDYEKLALPIYQDGFEMMRVKVA